MTDKIKDLGQDFKGEEPNWAGQTGESVTSDSETNILDKATTLRLSEANTDDKAVRRTRTVATVILIILILIILSACLLMYSMLRPGGLNVGRQHAGITWIRSIYGHGLEPLDLINPSSVTFAPDGQSFWITDSPRFRLVNYDLNGRLIEIVYADWRENQMIHPTRIAISPQGWFYVAEQTYNVVHVFNEDFVHQARIDIELPTAVAANDDMLLIGSRRGFAAFTFDGEPIGMHAADSEDEINRFDYVHALALDNNNNSFVLDSFGNRLVKYDPEGVPVYEVLLGHPGNEGILGGRDVDERDFQAHMQLPQGIALDGNGRLYIIDMFDFSVAVFYAETGEFVKKVGTHGTEDGRFLNPNCIDYNPSMDMFASAEASLGRVQLFAIDGSGDLPSQLRRQLGDFLSACCIPLIIILIIIAAYLISRFLAKKRREKETSADLTEPNTPAARAAANKAKKANSSALDATGKQQE
ncbi:MAG: hypothetical protein FWC86_04280 [Coriobacteriia bacterium]|nr:hypothetical protein [Coriobacteriia bacterium]